MSFCDNSSEVFLLGMIREHENRKCRPCDRKQSVVEQDLPINIGKLGSVFAAFPRLITHLRSENLSLFSINKCI